MFIKKNLLNYQVLIEILCYLIFAILMFYLVISGKYLLYVTPRMIPYFYFAGILMVAWVFESFSRLFKPKYKSRAVHCLVLAIPIIMLTIPHNPIGTQNLTSSYLSRSELTDISQKNTDKTIDVKNTLKNSANNNKYDEKSTDNSYDENAGKSTEIPAENNNDKNSESIIENNSETNLHGLDEVNKKITVDDEEYYQWLQEIYNNMNKYEGYQISIKGFVFRDGSTMKKNEFVPARMLMTCCVADLSLCGIICVYDKASQLTEKSWITVDGTITLNEYNGHKEPQIAVNNTAPAEKPVEEYVYPF